MRSEKVYLRAESSILCQNLLFEPAAIFFQAPRSKTPQAIKNLEDTYQVCRCAHLKRSNEVATKALARLGRRGGCNVQMPEIAVNGDGKYRHIETILFCEALFKLGGNPDSQWDHGILRGVKSLDFDTDKHGSHVDKRGRLIDAGLGSLGILTTLEGEALSLGKAQPDCAIYLFIRVFERGRVFKIRAQ